MLNPNSRKTTLQGIMKVLLDGVIVCYSYYLSYFLRFGLEIPESYFVFFRNSLPMVLLVKLYFIYDFKLYRGEWKYTSIHEVFSLLKATFSSSVTVVLAIWLSGLINSLPRAVIALDGCITLMLLSAVRILPRLLQEGLREPVWNYLWYLIRYRKMRRLDRKARQKEVLIYGAGDAGEMVVRDMKQHEYLGYNPVGFIDDNPRKKGKLIHGVEILGDRSDLERIVDKYKVKEIIICVATSKGKTLKEIIRHCEETGITPKIVPTLSEIVDGRIRVSNIRNIKLEDLLGREAVQLDADSISGYLRGRNVLVTGAGGSIGSELCRQIVKFGPRSLILLGRGENSIFSIHNELRAKYPDAKLVQVIGDVINRTKVEKVFEIYRPQIVFHAGADKHVPLMEMNADEAVLNNIAGTQNVIHVSEQMGVERVICISTDKAVRPTSVMGACKRIAERLIQAGEPGRAKVMGVRFGNVLGSRGSVIPVFEKQIQAGGPLTVTDKRMERFLMTIPEASQLVIQAGAIGRHGDLFVLDMGDPVVIDELARTMIRLAGYKPDTEIEIVYSGIRPGEKLYEELTWPQERMEATSHPKILRISDETARGDHSRFLKDIDELKRVAIEMDYSGVVKKLEEMIPEYGSKQDKKRNPSAGGKSGSFPSKESGHECE